MKTRLTILCENAVGIPFGVVGEHGFACLVETRSAAYLFDTGQGMGIVPNALALRKDLSEIDAVLISHGHYDHTGGLPAVLKLRGPVDVRAHPGIFARRVWTNGAERRDVGIPYRRSYLESLGARFRLETGWVEAGPGVFLTGEVPRETPFEGGDPHMALVAPDGSTRPDPLLDDLSMVVAADSGLVLVLGCAHAGMVNILRHVRRLLYTTDDLVRERAAEAIAAVAAVLERTAPAKLSELVAALLWTLNDESGMSGRGTPESIGRIVERIPARATNLVPMLIAYLEKEEIALNDEILDGGLLAALGRLGSDLVTLGDAGVARLRGMIASTEARIRGTAAWTSGRLRIEALRADLESLRKDETPFPLYRG